jgi:hypothetical protein
VTVRDADGVAHAVDVQGTSLYEAAAAALDVFRTQDWAASALTPAAVLHVEVRLPAVVHDVPVKAVERWLRSPSTSPRDALVKRGSGRTRG